MGYPGRTENIQWFIMPLAYRLMFVIALLGGPNHPDWFTLALKIVFWVNTVGFLLLFMSFLDDLDAGKVVNAVKLFYIYHSRAESLSFWLVRVPFALFVFLFVKDLWLFIPILTTELFFYMVCERATKLCRSYDPKMVLEIKSKLD